MTYLYGGISIGSCTNVVIEFDVVKGCAPAIHLSDCDNIHVSNCLLESNVGGMDLYRITGGSTVENCRVIGSYTPGGIGGSGIIVWGSNNVSIYRNTVTDVAYIGLFVAESSQVRFILNTVSNCGSDALRLQENVTDCEITGNSLTNASAGISLWIASHTYSPDGVTWFLWDWGFIDGVRMWFNEISGCAQGGIVCHMYTQQAAPISNLEIAKNVITNNTGPGIWLRQVELASVFENNILDNSGGVYLTDCYNATVYHNNLIGNAVQASDDSNNVWDAGYPSGGNYWSDYSGTDVNNDGIGDSPYAITISGQDRYPLMRQLMI
jgi:parallel beta-helix repeat protein